MKMSRAVLAMALFVLIAVPGRAQMSEQDQAKAMEAYMKAGEDRLANALDNLITLCAACHHRAEFARGTRSALGGLAYALGNIAPLYLMCDPRDLAVEAEVRGRQTRGPTLTFYDRLPEGLGLSERLYEHQRELLAAALDLVQDCGCSEGCPACVGPIAAGRAEVKQLTARLLRAILQTPGEAPQAMDTNP